MKKLFLISLLIFVLSVPAGCGRETTAPPPEVADFAMDTYLQLSATGVSEDELTALVDEVKALEERWSVTRPQSEIATINREGRATVGGDTAKLLSTALSICGATDGALDLSVYPLVRAWGFTEDEYRVPTPEEIEALKAKVAYEKIAVEGDVVSVAAGMEIDLGSVAKGYVGDLLLERLREQGADSALLDFGGNIQTLGKKSDGSLWKVAIREPEGEEYLGIAEVADKAVITSGGYERYFEDENGELWWHIIDPDSGYPAKNGLVSVTVIGDRGVYCDALSTALFVMGREDATAFWREHRDFEMILVDDADTVWISPGVATAFTLTAVADYSLQVIDDVED